MVFLRKLYSEFGEDLFGIALKGCIESTVTIDDDEPEGRLTDEELLLEVVEVEFGVAVIDGEVDGLEWLKIAD